MRPVVLLALILGAFSWGSASPVPAAAQESNASPSPDTIPYDAERGVPWIETYENYSSWRGPVKVGHSQNWSIAQGADRTMYVANQEGLLRYDGERWTAIPVGASQATGRRSTRVLSVAALPDEQSDAGRILVGAEGTFGVLRPDSLGQDAYISLSARLPEDERDLGTVWKTSATSRAGYFLTNDRFFRWRADSLHTWTPTDLAVPADVDTTAFAPPDERQFFFSFVVRDTLYVQVRGVGLLRAVAARYDVCGGIAFGQRAGRGAGRHPLGHGLHRWDGPHRRSSLPHPTVTQYGLDDGLPVLIDLNVFEVDGRVYFGTRQGLHRFDAARDVFVRDSRPRCYVRGRLGCALHLCHAPPRARARHCMGSGGNFDARQRSVACCSLFANRRVHLAARAAPAARAGNRGAGPARRERRALAGRRRTCAARPAGSSTAHIRESRRAPPGPGASSSRPSRRSGVARLADCCRHRRVAAPAVAHDNRRASVVRAADVFARPTGTISNAAWRQCVVGLGAGRYGPVPQPVPRPPPPPGAVSRRRERPKPDRCSGAPVA